MVTLVPSLLAWLISTTDADPIRGSRAHVVQNDVGPLDQFIPRAMQFGILEV